MRNSFDFITCVKGFILELNSFLFCIQVSALKFTILINICLLVDKKDRIKKHKMGEAPQMTKVLSH